MVAISAAATFLVGGYEFVRSASSSLFITAYGAAKELLYIPLSFDARYRAKQVIDTFTYRFSMGLTGGILSVITKAAGAIPGAAYTVLAMASTLAWAGLAVPLTDKKMTDARHA